MRPRIQQLAPQTMPSGAGQVQFKIGAQNFWVTGLGLATQDQYTLSTATAAEDWIARQYTAGDFYAGKAHYWNFNFRDIRPWYWSAQAIFDFAAFRMPDYINSNQTVYWFLPIPLHPYYNFTGSDQGISGLRIQDRLTGFAAARAGKRMAGIEPDTTLELDMTWGGTGLEGTAGFTRGTSTKLIPYLFGIEYDQGEEASLPVMSPRFQTTSATPDQTYSGEGWTVKLPTGVFLEHSTLMTLKGAVTNSGDVRDSGYGTNSISEVALRTSDGRKPLDAKVYDYTHMTQGFRQVAQDNSDVAGASLTGGASVITTQTEMGVIPIPYKAFSDSAKTGIGKRVDPDFGADLRQVLDTAIVVKETVDATTNIVQAIAHRAYVPR